MLHSQRLSPHISNFRRIKNRLVRYVSSVGLKNVCETSRLGKILKVNDYALPASIARRILSPVVCVHLDKVRSNCNAILALCGGDPNRWRPHIKTTKVPEIWRELSSLGIHNFKCATTKEAECLARTMTKEGFGQETDILLAMSLRGANLYRYAEIVCTYPDINFSVLVEDTKGVLEVAAITSLASVNFKKKCNIGIFIDLNCGQNRTGIQMLHRDNDENKSTSLVVADIISIMETTAKHNICYRGLHMYDGHAGTWNGGASRKSKVHTLYDQLLNIVAIATNKGIETHEVITSGTPSLTASLEHCGLKSSGIHRTSAGTVVLHDLKSDLENEDLSLVPAAVVMSRVLSNPMPQYATIDAGSKTIPIDPGNPPCLVIGHQQLLPLSPSEEHLPLDASCQGSEIGLRRSDDFVTGVDSTNESTDNIKNESTDNSTGVTLLKKLERGQEVYLVPTHICPAMNLAETVLLLDNNKVVDFANVEARSHECLLINT